MLVGAGLAGTYMPGLQILNARLDDSARVRAVPGIRLVLALVLGDHLLSWELS